jgi:hypothetical protein
MTTLELEKLCRALRWDPSLWWDYHLSLTELGKDEKRMVSVALADRVCLAQWWKMVAKSAQGMKEIKTNKAVG